MIGGNVVMPRWQDSRRPLFEELTGSGPLFRRPNELPVQIEVSLANLHSRTWTAPQDFYEDASPWIGPATLPTKGRQLAKHWSPAFLDQKHMPRETVRKIHGKHVSATNIQASGHQPENQGKTVSLPSLQTSSHCTTVEPHRRFH